MPDASLHGNLISSISCDTIRQALLDVGGGLSNVVAINPETRHVSGRTADPATAAQWAAARNAAGDNVYFSVNAPKDGSPDSKLRKDHIDTIRALHVDIDPRPNAPLNEERARLQQLAEAALSTACPPSAIIDSGGGFQLFWLLQDPIPATPANVQWAEAQGRALSSIFGGDATQNVDRIMRLPGSVNWPDAKKRAAGRTPAVARPLPGSRRRVTRQQLEAYAAPAYSTAATAEDASGQVNAIISAIDMAAVYEGPTPDLLARLNAAAASNPKLAAALEGQPPSGADQSPSAFRASLVARLCTAGGFTPTEYATIAYNLPHCRGRDFGGEWPRQFAREWVNIGVKHAVEHWFNPIDPPAPGSHEALFERMAAAANADDAPGAARFNFLSFHDAADTALSQSTRPLIKGLLDQQAMTVLYGESNVGKTFIALDIAYHIWAGVDYDGMRTTQGDVIYIAAEGGTGILKRVRALAVQRNPTRKDGFHILRSQVNLLDPTADLADLVAAINSACERPALIVVDTLSRVLAGGDENSSTDMGALVRNLDAIREKTTAHVMVIHHTGKDKAKGARGHSLLRAATDTEIEVTDGFVTVTKQRDLEKSWNTGFKLRQVPLGFDADGDPVNGAVVDLCPPEDVVPAPAAEGGGEAGSADGSGRAGGAGVRGVGVSAGKKGVKPKAGSLGQIVSIVGTLCASSAGRKVSTHDILAAVNRTAQRDKDKISPKTLLNKLVELRKNGEIISPDKGFWAMDEDKLSRFDVFS